MLTPQYFCSHWQIWNYKTFTFQICGKSTLEKCCVKNLCFETSRLLSFVTKCTILGQKRQQILPVRIYLNEEIRMSYSQNNNTFFTNHLEYKLRILDLEIGEFSISPYKLVLNSHSHWLSIQLFLSLWYQKRSALLYGIIYTNLFIPLSITRHVNGWKVSTIRE